MTVTYFPLYHGLYCAGSILSNVIILKEIHTKNAGTYRMLVDSVCGGLRVNVPHRQCVIFVSLSEPCVVEVAYVIKSYDMVCKNRTVGS